MQESPEAVFQKLSHEEASELLPALGGTANWGDHWEKNPSTQSWREEYFATMGPQVGWAQVSHRESRWRGMGNGEVGIHQKLPTDLDIYENRRGPKLLARKQEEGDEGVEV